MFICSGLGKGCPQLASASLPPGPKVYPFTTSETARYSHHSPKTVVSVFGIRHEEADNINPISALTDMEAKSA